MTRFLLCLLCIPLFFSCKQNAIEVEAEYAIPFSEKVIVPSSGFAHLPRLKVYNGKLHMTWVEQQDSLVILKYANYASAKWSPTEIIASGTDWFVNWADFPAVAINEETVMATFLQKSAKGTYDYDIQYTIRNSETGKWSIPETLHNDGITAEHGFVTLLAYETGFFATWLDGRNTKPVQGGQASHDNHSGDGAMTLRSAIISKDGAISKRKELDQKVCDCCNTTAAQTDKGVVVVYRDRSDGALETRDIYSTLWLEDGWTVPTPVHNDNWRINGCPVNGPAVDAKGDTVVATWFTAANDTPKVLAAFSKDGGLNFGMPLRIDTKDAIGRVAIKILDDESAIVLWMEPDGDDVLLKVKRIYADGHTDTAQILTAMSGERASGFPQLEILGNTLYIAWTAIETDTSTIEMLSFALTKP